MGQSWSSGRFTRELTPCGIRTFDPGTGETINVECELFRKFDFLEGTTTVQLPFVVRDTHAEATEVNGTNFVGGSVQLDIGTTAAAQLAGIDFADQLLLDVNKGLNVEAKIKFTSADFTSNEFAFGFSTAHNAAVGSLTAFLLARMSGSLAVNAASKDGVVAAKSNAAVQTWVTAGTHIIRLAAHNLSACEMWWDGAVQTLATALDLSAIAANNKVQPVCRLGREAAAGTVAAKAEIDYIAFWSRR